MYLSNIAVTYETIAATKHTVTWDVNGDQSVATQVTEGSKPTFPTTPASCDDESKTFYGWATATWDGKIDDINGKTIYTSANEMPEVDGAVTYYAVFAKEATTTGGTTTTTFIAGTDNIATGKNGIKFTMSNTTGPDYYQVYSGSAMTISSDNPITSFIITCTASGTNKYGPGNITFKTGSYSYSGTNGTWTGNSKSIESNNSSAQLRIKTITVTTSGAQTTTYSDFITTCTEPSTFTVTYNTNGGTTIDETSGTTLPDPLPTTTKTGYTFAGWYTNSELTIAATAGAAITQNTILYAKWTVNTYTISFDLKGGTDGTESIDATYGEIMPDITKPTRIGYTFGGYWTNEDGTGTQYYNQSGKAYYNKKWDQDADATLYAKWTANTYTVKFDANGGDGSMDVQSFIYDKLQNLAVNTFERPGCTFKGWNTNKSGSGTSYTDGQEVINLNSTSGGQITLYAQWTELSKYTVSFSTGTGNPTQVAIQETIGGAGIILPTGPTPTCTDWDFAGWAETIVTETTTAPTLLAASSNYKPTSDITLYAIYSKTETTQGGGTTSTDASLSFASTAQRTSFSSTQQVWEQNGIILTNNKSASTSPVADYSNPARFYASSEIIIEAPGNITQIVATCPETKYATALVNSVGTGASSNNNVATIIPAAPSTTYTIAKLAAQVQMLSLAVTYTTSGGGSTTTTTYYHSTPECGPQKLATPNVELTYNCSSATITWDAVTNAKAYWYQIIKTGDKNSGISSTNTTYTRNDIEPGVSYTWSVKTIGDGSKFSDSEIATGTFTAYSIQWLANGELIENACGKAGEAIVVPTPNPASCDGTKEFVGWTATPIDGSIDTEPNDLFTTSPGNINGNATYHAVFATKSTGSGETTIIKTETFSNQTSHQSESNWQQALTWGAGESNIGVQWTTYYGKIDNGYTEIRTYSNEEMGYIWSSQKIKGIKSIQFNGWHVTESDAADMVVSYSKNNDNDWIEIGTHTAGNSPDSRSEVYTIPEAGPEEEYYISIDLHNATCPSSSNKKYRIDNISLTILEGANTPTTYSGYVTTCDNTKATITYDLNGGTGATCEQQTITKGDEFTLCNQTPTKTGYNFAGWTDGLNTYDAGASTSVTDNTKFYAKWTAKTITITWNQNYTGCPEPIEMQYVYDSDENTMPEKPVREGYQFVGWFTGVADGIEITEIGEENRPTDNVIYYAHWNELYSVTFMVSGQVYVVQEDKYINGDAIELPDEPSAANYACDGYLFEGWSTYQQTKEDANCPELVDANTLVENDLELHAIWKKASTSGAGTQIFYESFDTENGTGGNDGKWSGDIAKNNKVNTTWTFENEGGAYQCIKLGSGSKKGSATTPALTQLSGDAILSFKAAAWNSNSESTILKLSISGGGTLTQTSVTLVKGAWTTYEVTITDGTPSSKITFEAVNAANNRFFLDEVMITTSGSYNYTTSPNCGPTMVAKENVWATSATGQSVKVNVPLGIKQFEGAATIIGTSTNENFVVNTLENAGNGEHQVVVVYTPTADDTKENTTITLTAKNGEEIWCTTTFTLNGRSLPTEFVVVANRGDKNYALPANMTEANTYPGLEVEVNGNEVTAAPMSHLYIARAVHSTRFTENGTALRLVGNNDACLWASTAKDGTSIRNYANISNATDSQYEWNLYTEDGETYRISCTAVTEEGRILRMYGQKFGMYKSGNDAFRILPVECTSTPLNVSVSAARTSATISWTNADACNVEVYNGSTKVQTISAAASPVVVSNLVESTAYTFTLTPAYNESCVASGAFTTTGPTIDIVEWETNGILIQVDKDNELNPKVIIKGEEEHGNVGGNVADELFFSKYFESHGENKLLAIFNGTTATIDLNGYTIKSENGTLDLSQFGQTKGKVASNEEIILVYYDANYSAEECAEEQQGYENWNILTEKGVLAFSGRGSLGLYKNDVLIDVIGSTFPSGELTKIGKSDQGCGTGGDVRLHIGGKSVNDQSSFFCYNGDNHKTTEVETDYPISTNRCLLIRKNTVTSGANAVASNKAKADATCGDLSSTFTTLCSEWSGFRIGSGSSSNAEIQNATCDGLGYVGGFDYNNYYRTLETLDNSKTLNEYTHNADENTYFIEIANLAQYSCLNIQLQLTDNDGNVLTEQTSQVPVLVAGEKSTTDPIFSAIVKDSETSEPDYETSKIRCSTCDVVILKNATLTKADAKTVNDVNQVRDIYIYPGGKLVVPANATDYSVNNVSLRRVQDEVAAADIQAPLNITSSSKAPIFVDVRIDANNWHWFTLPYDCNVADVTWADGSKAAYNTDWFLMYYDGESRAASTNPHDNHWKVYEGTKIEAGKGYIVGITGNVSKPAVKFELRFPMAQDVLTAEKDDKKVAVNAWGVKSNNKPNNLGWNLVGNPYLNYYKTADEYSPLAGLPLIHYTNTDPVTGEWYYENSGSVPYVATPIDGGWYEYQQELASGVNLMPFTAYFVQVGDPNTHENGQDLNASFEASNRGKKSIVRRAPREVEEIEEPIIVRVELTNSKGESDKTSLVIDDRFTNEYEMNGDFFKWFGDYYNYYTKPVLYTIGADQGKRAFNALNEELAKQPIPMGMYAAQAGNYTFSLNQQFDLSRVEEVWLYDATQSTYTNLMQSDYTFSTSKVNGAGRFSLSVKLAPKVATSIDNVTADKVWATTHTKQVIVNGLENGMHLWLYDATGKLLYNEPTSNYQHTYSVPQTGTYFVSVMKGNAKQTIKVVVE